MLNETQTGSCIVLFTSSLCQSLTQCLYSLGFDEHLMHFKHFFISPLFKTLKNFVSNFLHLRFRVVCCGIAYIENCQCIGHPSSTVGTSDLSDVDRPRNYYKYFVSHDIETEIIQVCQLLGYYGDIPVLVDHFLELFTQSSVYRKQAAFCINEIIAGSVRPPMTVLTIGTHKASSDMDNILRLSH